MDQYHDCTCSSAVSHPSGPHSTTGCLSLNHVTATENVADRDEDGNGDGGGVAGNQVGSGSGSTAPDLPGNFTSGGFSLIGDDSGSAGFIHGVNGNPAGTGSSPLDARLGPLQDNGGPTPTHALGLDSPAVDAGAQGGTG